jgi:hypothetical protein
MKQLYENFGGLEEVRTREKRKGRNKCGREF